jgi:amyloid beta precursor protein binding protein 1
VESKPDFPKTDALRVREPFPELRAYADTWNFDTLTTVEHAHIPFPVILIKAADAWKASVRPYCFAESPLQLMLAAGFCYC